MEQLIATIEKGQPFFNAIARNKYLKAIRDGFISVIPIIIFSSIFCLVASVPNIWGFYWPDDINNALWKCYNYSMGILAIACAATTAKHFADAQNRDLPKNNQINFISCMCAAIIGFLLLSSDTIATDAASGFNTTYLGSKGLLTAFIAAFVTGIIYKFFIKRNITVKMPEQVPPNISQTFKDIIPFSVCIAVFWVFDIVFRAAFGFCFAQGVIRVFQPLFTAADGYIGLAVIYGAMSLFWFVGVHGPSIVEPAIAAALVANMTDNLAAFQAGQHASAVLTQGAQYFVVCMGGTGATLVLVFMFCFLAKSQEMRAVGKAAIVPVCFAVNEPPLSPLRQRPPATSTASACSCSARVAAPRACSPTRWPRPPKSAASILRPLPRPMATTLTCFPTLTWSSWPRRPPATWPTCRRTASAWATSASPAAASSTSSSPRTAISLSPS